MLPISMAMLDTLLALPGSPDMTQYAACRKAVQKLFIEVLPLRVLRSLYVYHCAPAQLLAKCLFCSDKVRGYYETAFAHGKLMGFVHIAKTQFDSVNARNVWWGVCCCV